MFVDQQARNGLSKERTVRQTGRSPKVLASEVERAIAAKLTDGKRKGRDGLMGQGKRMPIQRLLEGSGLGPAEVERLCRAYEDALHGLHLVDRNDPVTEMVARKVIEIGKSGGDPAEIARLAIKAFGVE